MADVQLSIPGLDLVVIIFFCFLLALKTDFLNDFGRFLVLICSDADCLAFE